MDPRGQSWIFLRRDNYCQNSNPGLNSEQPSLCFDCGVQAKIVHVIQLNILLIIQSASVMVMCWILETTYRISS